ncbi:MAG: dockerin type I repeat-containing protein [Ruminococcus sp.]|nr:dockerin type I repeat-containing protein [Ruminococcus sp.]
MLDNPIADAYPAVFGSYLAALAEEYGCDAASTNLAACAFNAEDVRNTILVDGYVDPTASTEYGLFIGTCNPFYGGQLYLLQTADDVPTQGYTLSGTVKAPAADGKYFDGIQTVSLIKDDVEVKSVTAQESYELSGIMPDSYILRISGKNCVTHDYEITVEGDTQLDIQICPIGDANLDEKVNIRDVNTLYNHVKGSAEITDAYALKCADVNGKSGVNIRDSNMLYNHVTGISCIWQEIPETE